MNQTRHLRMILIGGFAIGTLDGIAAIINVLAHGGTVTRLFQFVAAGLLGPASFDRGLGSVLLGVFLEYFIATGVMAVFYLASRWFPVLVRYAVISGILYGVAAFFFMNKIVVPLSGAPRPKAPPVLSRMLIEIGIHIFCVGLPAALVTRALNRSELTANSPAEAITDGGKTSSAQ